MDYSAICETKARVHELQKEARRYQREATELKGRSAPSGSPLARERRDFVIKSKVNAAERLEREAQMLISTIVKAPW